MKPSVEQMLEAAQQALRDLVAPTVQDQWAASALRSVDVILSHLQARAPVEGPMLFEDNRDLAALLSEVPTGLIESETALGPALTGFAADAGKLLNGYPPVGELVELSQRGRSLIDELLLLCHAGRTAEAAAYHDRLRRYLHRHLERETPFFFPTYVGRPV